MRKTGILLALMCILGAGIAHAQGKIAGRVIDAASGEPLIGVNVSIAGTTQGTMTDVDGNYIILNVRPGTHSLLFSYIGFAQQRVDGVRVATGQTTEYDVEMREQVIEGEEVVIVAERPLVQKDLTSSSKTVNAEEIEALPVEGFFGVLTTQAGVTTGPGGTIHIRGGRSNEVAYLVDGMSVGNPFETNGLATSVAADAIQEMTVISGAFNAEYGKAMSGIVNLVTKEGGEKIHGSVSMYGGNNFTQHTDVFLNDNSLRPNVYTLEGTLSGALPFYKKLRFFVSGRYDYDEGHIYGERTFLPSDSSNFNGDPGLLADIQEYIPDYDGPLWYYEIQGKPWYEWAGQDIPSERVALNPNRGHNLITKLSMRPWSGTKIEYSLILDGGKSTPFSFGYRYNPDGVSSFRSDGVNHGLGWTHTLDDRSFYTLRMSYASNESRSFLYEDPLDPRYVSTGASVGFPGNNFLMGGNQKGHVTERSDSWRIKADLTKQIGVTHEVKTGIEYNLHLLDRRNFTVLFDGDQYRTPTVPDVTTPAHDYYEDQKVTELSLYIQDKLEFEDFIINAGVRYERFDPHGLYIPNLLDPQRKDDPLREADVTNVIMPRLGVSFPITETGIIHFSYGHFAQMPRLRNLYINPEFEFPVGQAPTFGNTNMRPERTVQYEIGLQQQLTETLAFDVTGFFKDIRDYLALQTIRFSTIAGEDVYSIYQNRDYANVKGVTFALTSRRPRGGLLSANVDYTFQIAEGNNTDANSFFFNSLSGRETELEIVPLSFDQRHVLSSTVTISPGPAWGISLIGQLRGGYPYTPLLIDQKIDQLPNQERKPATSRLDLHIYKEFALGGQGRLRVFGKVFNVLDRLNENFVFDDTGRATYSLSEQRGVFAAWQRAAEMGLPGIRSLDEYENRPQYFSAPREIRLGATLSF
ncbi:MAG: TonB-dependent receptor [Rhodothermales bacterium]